MIQVSSTFSSIDKLFHPRAVAVVGAGNKPGNQGRWFLKAMDNPNYKGELYAIHPRDDVKGYKSYRSLLEVPGPVDHAILSVPAAATINVVEDCGKKGVRSAALFTSGFAEEGTEEGRVLQAELVQTARKGGVRLIGPNCMGFHCPRTGLSFRQDHPLREGPLAFVTQSGGICMTAIFIGESKGLGFSKAISYGNESDLGAAELLHYLAEDPETGAILVYVEGTHDGAAFLEALKHASSRKPVVMLKGGITSVGTKAALSHTGAMAGSSEMWEAAARQAGVPMVPSMDELIDTAQAFVQIKKPAGRNVGLITISGGFGVFATDVLTKAGFSMPSFTKGTTKVLTRLIKQPGTSIKNPVDMASAFFHMKKYPKLFATLGADPAVDIFVVLVAVEYLTRKSEDIMSFANLFVSQLIAAFGHIPKPVAVVFFQTTMNEKRLELERYFIDAGYPVFPTVERCADAISRRLNCVA